MTTAFKNKIVVITGGTEGIGKALVEQFLLLGSKVVTCSRNHDRLYQLQSSHPSYPLHTVVCDVSRENDCRQLMQAAVKMFGGIDILINNAGISMHAEFMDTNLEVMHKVMDTNYFGAVHCTKYALPEILKNNGIIVGISSVAGYRGLPGRSGYSASKFALQGWLEALRIELKETGVHAMWVCPSFTATNIRYVALDKDGNAQGESPLNEESLMTAKNCALEIIRAIKHKRRSVIMSWDGKLSVLLNKIIPGYSENIIRNFFYKDGKLIK